MLNLICSQREQLSHDLLRLSFRSSTGKLPVWQPGQYFNFHTIIAGQKVVRSYSVSTGYADELQIFVKLEGLFSRWLEQHCQPKQWLQVQGPFGDFGQRLTAEPCLFLAGGVGLSPLLGILQQRLAVSGQCNDRLVVCASDLDHLCQLPWLRQWQQQGLQLDVHLSQQASEHQGRLTDNALQRLCQGPETQMVCCGPDNLMAPAHLHWLASGKSPECWHQESFKVSQPVRQSAKSVQIEYQGEFFSGNDQQNLLDQLDEAGLYLSSSCRAGSCGSCRCRLVQGEVEAVHPFYALSEQEEQAGFILACCARPTSDVAIEPD